MTVSHFLKHLKLRRKIRKTMLGWERARQRLNYKIINKTICFPEGGYAFLRVVMPSRGNTSGISNVD